MDKLLPIGSVVQLKNGNVKIMIISRYPLYNDEGKLGYFDYSACGYPVGSTENQAYFFNHEDIETVYFEGYVDHTEEKMQEIFRSEEANIELPKFNIGDK